MNRWIYRWMGVLAGAFLLAGCSASQTPGPSKLPDEAEKLRVVTTLFPYYDFTRQIAGEEIELTMVIPAGMDSHSFEPTPADMLTIQNADILICNGGEMEQWLEQVLEAVDASGITVVAMMDHVDIVEEEHVEGMEDAAHGPGHVHETSEEDAHGPDHVHEASEEDGHEMHIEYDEHIWTSPANAMKIVETISAVLQEMDPQNSRDYRENAKRYLGQLEKLHQSFLKLVEEKQRNMIIVGDKFPFRYLADQYGFAYRAAFSGCSTDTEPSAKTIAYLIDKVREQNMPAVYYLELSSHRVSEIIGEETGAVPLLLHSCHNVSRVQFDGGITYLELMEQNVENLRKGLVE